MDVETNSKLVNKAKESIRSEKAAQKISTERSDGVIVATTLGDLERR